MARTIFGRLAVGSKGPSICPSKRLLSGAVVAAVVVALVVVVEVVAATGTAKDDAIDLRPLFPPRTIILGGSLFGSW